MNCRQKGFTLVELLVGVTILSIVVTTVYASLRIGLDSYRRLEEQNYLHQNVRQAFRCLSRDVSCAFVSGNPETAFIGETDAANGEGSGRITFATFLPGHLSEAGGLAKIAYYIDTDPLTPHEGLVREDYGYPMKRLEGAASAKQEIAPLVKSLRLRYFDGAAWHETWDKSAGNRKRSGSLPLAVEIRIVVRQEEQSVTEEVFTSVVPVLSNDVL